MNYCTKSTASQPPKVLRILSSAKMNSQSFSSKENGNVKKLCFAILTVSTICFAWPPEQPTEKCNPNPDPDSLMSSQPGENFDKNLRKGVCYDYGYVCKVTMDPAGGVRFSLGKDQDCQDMKYTFFKTYPRKSDGNLSPKANYWLAPYLQEGMVGDYEVSALAVAVNTAFIINASKKKYRVKVAYHQFGEKDEKSIKLLEISSDHSVTQQP